MKRIIALTLLYVILTAVLLPSFITAVWKKEDTVLQAPPIGIEQKDLVEAKGEAESLPKLTEFESYILGVVAAEMPLLFPKEAQKAQAVAARTYAVRKMEEMKTSAVPYDIGQAYIDEAKRKERFGEHFLEYEKRLSEVILETQGEIMVYEDEPILAVFHAQSGGRTEKSENVWSSPLPYLQSVDSSKDEKAPDFEAKKKISCQEAAAELKNNENADLSAENLVSKMKIISRSDAGYVREINVGGRVMTGKELREALGLRSANFTFEEEGSDIVFTTKGYGHGAGMSQYGAKFMADEGKNYHDILNHYYIGVQFENQEEKPDIAE